jgi:hypothetical protein
MCLAIDPVGFRTPISLYSPEAVLERIAGLEDFEDFHEAVVLGDTAQVTALVNASEAAGRERSYAEALPRMFDEQLRAERIEGAVNVVLAMLTVEALRTQTEPRNQVVTKALPRGHLARALVHVDAATAVEAGGSLSPDDRAGVLMILARRLGDPLPESEKARIVSALTPHAESLPDGVQEAIRQAIAAENADAVFYLPLAYANPHLMPEVLGRKALGRLDELAKSGGEGALVRAISEARGCSSGATRGSHE